MAVGKERKGKKERERERGGGEEEIFYLPIYLEDGVWDGIYFSAACFQRPSSS
jgi:hypothetical protein